jgi:hypothetical protein
MHALLRWVLVGFLLLNPTASIAISQSLQLFPTETEAQKHCPADIVVWINTPTGIYHFKGMRWYGNTKSGAYICKKEGDGAGYRPALNGQ